MQHIVIASGMDQRAKKNHVCGVWCSTNGLEFRQLELHGLFPAIAI